MQKSLYQLKIYLNGEEKFCSDVCHLSEDFQLTVQQAFHLWMHDRPAADLTVSLVQINSRNGIKKAQTISDVHVPFPEP